MCENDIEFIVSQWLRTAAVKNARSFFDWSEKIPYEAEIDGVPEVGERSRTKLWPTFVI